MGYKYIYTTLSNDNRYTNYGEAKDGGLAPALGGVFISGGSNVADKREETPIGVMTRVSDEQYAYLLENPDFQLHTKNGFITVRDDVVDPEVAVSENKTRDLSAPLTPNDFKENDGQAKPVAAPKKGSKKK